jgi:murein DD-endopeptidase MepM/ murein hydrolase activator NlpD
LVVLAALQGCSGMSPMAVGSSASSASRQAPIVTVREGDTVWSLAQRYGVPLREMIDANGLRAPYLLRVGQSLLIPTGRTYQVAGGDTVSGLSDRFGVPMSELVRLNRLRAPYTIYVGQTLRLPFVSQPQSSEPTVQVALATPPAPVPRPSASVAQAPTTTVRPFVGLRPPPSTTSMAAGGITATALPPGAPAPAPSVSAPSVTPAQTRPAPPAAIVQTPIQAAPTPVTTVAVAAPPAAAPATAAGGRLPPIPARASTGHFAWPVDGRVVSSFGPKGEGLRNDGINIAAPKGTAVRAAENGVVVYAGDALRAFGNLLLIRHADGWVSAYAHADRLLVKRGEVVSRGQTVATVGSSGDVTQPQLHFQLRRQDKAVDPKPLLS